MRHNSRGRKNIEPSNIKILDKSPKQMIDERIMLEAKRLLAHTSESVKRKLALL